MSLPDNLIHTCRIKQSAHVVDDIAADYDDPIIVNEDEDDEVVDCWIQSLGNSEIIQYQRRDQRVTHTVFFRGNPNVRPGYIIIPASGPFEGATMEVRSATECTAGTGLLWEVIVEEIQPR